jgi:hypothetical protein
MINWIGVLILLAALGAGILLIGVLLLDALLRQARAATERAEAVIVGNEAGEDDEAHYFTPVARFRVGQTYYVRGQLAACGRPLHRVGQRLSVHYPPGEPDRALLYRYEGWWIALLPVFVGGGFLLGVAFEVVKLLR